MTAGEENAKVEPKNDKKEKLTFPQLQNCKTKLPTQYPYWKKTT